MEQCCDSHFIYRITHYLPPNYSSTPIFPFSAFTPYLVLAYFLTAVIVYKVESVSSRRASLMSLLILLMSERSFPVSIPSFHVRLKFSTWPEAGPGIFS